MDWNGWAKYGGIHLILGMSYVMGMSRYSGSCVHLGRAVGREV